MINASWVTDHVMIMVRLAGGKKQWGSLEMVTDWWKADISKMRKLIAKIN